MKLSINSSSPSNLLTKEQLKSIYCKLFSGEDGKIILEDLAQMSGIYRSNFVRQESEYTAFLEGYLSFVPIYARKLQKMMELIILMVLKILMNQINNGDI